MAYKFVTSGDYIQFKDGSNVVLAELHNSSRAISWFYDSTTGITFTVKGDKYQVKSMSEIEFDGVACDSQDDFGTGIAAMFTGYASGDSSVVGYPEGTKMYLALLTQSGTGNPTATVLVNTLGGDVTYLRDDVGQYLVLSSGLFTTNKTSVVVQAASQYAQITIIDADSFIINTISDSALTKSTIQILVFP